MAVLPDTFIEDKMSKAKLSIYVAMNKQTTSFHRAVQFQVVLIRRSKEVPRCTDTTPRRHCGEGDDGGQ